MMRADDVVKSEGSIFASVMASGRIPLRGLRARHDVQCVDSNSGGPCHSPPRGSMADNAANGGSQMGTWESDTAIVPMIPGNAGVGKGVYMVRLCSRETLSIHSDRKMSGNATEQNKRFKALT